jgi:hypothetical protein
MPKTRTYNVTLMPAKKEGGFIQTEVMSSRVKRYTVEASSFDEMRAKVLALVADDFKMDCTAWASVPKGQRSPAGFDKYVGSEQSGFRFIKYTVPAEAVADAAD